MEHTPSIAFVTLGCPKNEVDSDRMAAAVRSSAYRLVGSVEDADVVVLNTCAFIQAATEESIAEAFALTNEWRTVGTGRRVVVAGCMPSRYGDDLTAAMPEVDAFVRVEDEPGLLEVLETLLGVPTLAASGPERLTPGPTAYLKVSEGCDRRCAYCTIPAIRGGFASASTDSLVAEARFLIENGACELVLVGQDIAAYGRDLTPPGDLATLLESLDALEGDFRLRLMYVQPDGVTDRLLHTIASSRHVCHYLDIPLQHASATVLRSMCRPGDPASHNALLARIRGALPDVVLRTTVMAGFPGETDEDVAELERFLAGAGFDYAGVFSYSAEEGTPAADMPAQVSEDEKLHRAQRLRDIADEVGFAKAAERTGALVRVLVEGYDEDGELVGRTCGQAPEVDGVTLLDGDARPGTFVDARVTASLGYDLIGEVM